MVTRETSLFGRFIVIVSYLAMIAANWLANAKPINGQTTGQVSDAYSNLFAPTGFTFAIWGLIYLLLGGYVLYHAGIFRDKRHLADTSLLEDVGIVFVVSCAANIAWIFAWHYEIIWLSMVLMIVLLICLIAANRFTHAVALPARDRFFIRLPFSVYFGWITVATVANATVLLVSLGWDGFGVSEDVWMVAVVSAAALIGVVTMLKNRDTAYGLVLLWAYGGILYKHTTESGFEGRFPLVITVVTGWMIVMALTTSLAQHLSNKHR